MKLAQAREMALALPEAVGLRLRLAKAPPPLVHGVLRAAWRHKAPRGLALPG